MSSAPIDDGIRVAEALHNIAQNESRFRSGRACDHEETPIFQRLGDAFLLPTSSQPGTRHSWQRGEASKEQIACAYRIDDVFSEILDSVKGPDNWYA